MRTWRTARCSQRREEELHRPGGLWVDQDVQEDELVRALGAAKAPVQTNGAAEVVHAQVCVVDVGRVEESVEDVGEEVEVLRDFQRFVGEALSLEVDGDDAMGFGELREDVAVEEVCLRRDSQLRALLEPLERVVVVEIEALEASIFGRWLGRAPRLRWRGLGTLAKLGLFGGVGWTFL